MASGGGTLRYAIGQPSAITPGEAVDPAGLLVVDTLFDSLTRHGRFLDLQPAAARRWEPQEGGALWRFTLRDGATFHDGSPVTAADFAYAWDRAVAGGKAAYHLADIVGYDQVAAGDAQHLAGVSALDERTLEVRLRAPHADFPAVVAHPALAPLPRDAVERAGAAFARQPVGNGPFLAAEPWGQGRFIRVRRFAQWRDPAGRERPAALDEVVFQILDPDGAYVAFQQGRLDIAAVPAGALDTALLVYGPGRGGDRGPGVLLRSEPTVYLLGFDLQVPPFDDVEVRRAVSMAVDREELARVTLEGNVRAARSLVPPSIPGATGLACAACRYAPDAARAIFAQRGITALPLWFNAGAGHEPVMELVAADLRAVGVRVVSSVVEFPAYLAALCGDQAGLFRFGWTADYPTLDNVLHPLLHSGGRGNPAGFADPEVDALLDQARATLDERGRRDLYRRAEQLALDRDQAFVPLFTYRHRLVVSERVDGFTLDLFGRPDLANVTVTEPTAAPSG